MNEGRIQQLGANFLPGKGVEFLVWAPQRTRVDVHVVSPSEQLLAMQRVENGYFCALAPNLSPGTRYVYRLDGVLERPDPASRFQPQGVHGPSEIIDPRFEWKNCSWDGMRLDEYVFYELHVGAFTSEGTFAAIVPRLGQLRDLGITAIELMPVAEFPGTRNWGYDGVFPFAVQHSYGGPLGLKQLVNACHEAGLAVALDVVYNHLGPEGNYLADYGPYFTDVYRTLWGAAINFDRQDSDEVRRFFIENALYWVREFHIDAFRLDAVHAIFDSSARPFLRELAEALRGEAGRLRRRVHVIAESNLNDARMIAGADSGGIGLHAQWNDDFHHTAHALLTGERSGYYADFGTASQLAKAFTEGFVLTGQYSHYRGRRHGDSSRAIPAERFVVFLQNHDQVGNRLRSDRLTALVSFESLKLAAALTLLSPFVPLLFMGEEYGETAPFPYFVSHGDQGVTDAVRKGRREEFSRFAWQGELPDPAAEDTFLKARLDWGLQDRGSHSKLKAFYKELLRLRQSEPALASLDKTSIEATACEDPKSLCLRRWSMGVETAALFHFEEKSAAIASRLPPGRWEKILDSAEERWGGPGSRMPGSFKISGETSITIAGRCCVLLRMVPG